MPFNSEQLAYAGNAVINYFLKNDPIDNYNVERPLIKKLMSGKQEYGGGLQYVVEQLRYQNDSNFQSYFGDSQVTYNRKRTLQQAKYVWGAFHDGFGLNEDELTQNGITMVDDRNASASDAEKVQLTNLLSENMDTLKLGFLENFDIMAHLDGTQSSTNIPGLDLLVSTASGTSQTVGTIQTNTTTNTWWQNYVQTAINSSTAGNVTTAMEQAWRAAIRVGGQAPNFILAGENFIDAYRKDSGSVNGSTTRQVIVNAGNKRAITLDNGVGSGTSTGLYFKGVEILWDPVFDTLDTTYAPAIPWKKRCYFLNDRHIKLRPIKGHWMIPRRPPRVYDRYVHYWGLTAKGAITTGKRNAHAVISIA
ncbi:MAG: phage major capsid protein [Patescibacteria group bacterium]|nr:phage major capsid protein [Patescibacteria group bacterium]